jgi:hypothetical protein
MGKVAEQEHNYFRKTGELLIHGNIVCNQMQPFPALL